MAKTKKTRKPRPGPRCCGCLRRPACTLPGTDAALCHDCLGQAMAGAYCERCDSDLVEFTVDAGVVRVATVHNPDCDRYDKRALTGVALEEMLDTVTAERREHPDLDLDLDPRATAIIDQTHAARDEAVAAWESAHPDTGRTVHDTPDDWIRLPLLDTVAKWTQDRANTCIHHPTPLRPEPVWACAWKPGLIVCTKCQWMLSVGVAGTPADRRCDRCGRVVAGTDNDDPIWSSTVWFNQLGYTFGACRDCASPAMRRVS
jgi:hypothetical protein